MATLMVDFTNQNQKINFELQQDLELCGFWVQKKNWFKNPIKLELTVL